VLIRRFLGLLILLVAIAGIVGVVAITIEDEENAYRLRREEVVVLPEERAAKVRLLDERFGVEDPIVRRSRGESLEAFARLETGFVPAPEPGTTVTVVFDPETPGMVKLDHPAVVWQNQIVLGILIVIFLLVGSALIRAPRGVPAPVAVPAARARAAKPARPETARQESVSRSATAARTESVARTGTAARASAVVQRTTEGAVVARVTHGPTIDRSGERTGPLGLILVIGVIVLGVLVYLFQGQLAALG
jgi:hypothetical protein